MANTPTLPDGIPQQSPAQQFPPPFQYGGLPGTSAAPVAFQLPPGTKMATPLAPFPPELQAKLDAARKSGSYCITVTQHEPAPGESDRITCYMCRTQTFNRDWLLRMWQTVLSLILSEGLRTPATPQMVIPPPPASESKTTEG